MTERVLFIQGAGEGAYLEDKGLANYLKSALSSGYEIIYPKFSGLENVSYEIWREEITSELEGFTNEAIIVAHSLGGSALLKYLSEVSISLPIAGIFLVAAPYKCTDGEWGTDDFAMDVNFASSLPSVQKLYLYHSRDDEWVPFSHLARWTEKMPHSIAREFDDRGHAFFNTSFAELATDIEAL